MKFGFGEVSGTSLNQLFHTLTLFVITYFINNKLMHKQILSAAKKEKNHLTIDLRFNKMPGIDKSDQSAHSLGDLTAHSSLSASSSGKYETSSIYRASSAVFNACIC